MGNITYVTGGARSGKSTFAEKLAVDYSKESLQKIYVATSIPFDKEMEDRVTKHREQRGENWITIEGYKGVANLISQCIKERELTYGVVLVDCMTILVTNLLLENRDIDWDRDVISYGEVEEFERVITSEVTSLLEFAKDNRGFKFIIVSNEVGLGLVPEYPLGRIFRDIAGRVNQIIGKYSSDAYFVVSGIPMRLK